MHFSGSLFRLAQRKKTCTASPSGEKPRALAAALRACDLQVCPHTTLSPYTKTSIHLREHRSDLHVMWSFQPAARTRVAAATCVYPRGSRPARSSSLARTAALNAAASVIHGTCLPPIMLNGSSPLASRYTSAGRGSS